MRSRLRNWLEELGDLFWLRPAALVLLGLVLGEAAAWAERSGVTQRMVTSGWIYAGGESGARALLSAVASSAIGVAGTVFSITVAALSLASGQMGPRLLRNFTRDPGNQIVLGTFLGTFAYALVLLRTVRSVEESAFVPHLGVTVALGLALLCVAALVWFVHHIANSINVDTVIGLVHADLVDAISSLEEGGDTPEKRPPPRTESPTALVCYQGNGYLRTLDEEALADWAASRGVLLRLRVRPGDYLFPGGAVADLEETSSGVAHAKNAASSTDTFASAAFTGERQAASQDLEFAIRQLVEVAVRALSPGINDPFTAMAVLERLGAALCEVAGRRLPDPVIRRHGRPVLIRRVTDYDGLCNAMFDMIRQNSGGSVAVLIRLLETLSRVAGVEQEPGRHVVLKRHAELALAMGQQEIKDQAGLADLETLASGVLRLGSLRA